MTWFVVAVLIVGVVAVAVVAACVAALAREEARTTALARLRLATEAVRAIHEIDLMADDAESEIRAMRARTAEGRTARKAHFS